MTATPPADPPAAGRYHPPRFRLLNEVGWWVLIGVLSVADGFGFYQNISLLLKFGNPTLLWVIVTTCSIAAVLLPWIFGRALLQRGRGLQNTGLVAAFAALLWVGLGATMFVIRVTASAVAEPPASLTPGDSIFAPAQGEGGTDAWLIAILLLLVFGATAITAGRHSYDVADQRCINDLLHRREELVGQLRREREARDQEDHLRRHLKKHAKLIRRAEALELEATQAFANLEYEEKVDALSEQLRDPLATETLLADYAERCTGRPAQGQPTADPPPQ